MNLQSWFQPFVSVGFLKAKGFFVGVEWRKPTYFNEDEKFKGKEEKVLFYE